MAGGVDPIYQQQQQQFFYNQGLEKAKKAQRERKSSKVKLGVVLAVVFVLAAAFVFVLGGGLSFAGSHHVMVDGISYRIGNEDSVVISMDEGFTEAGKLFYTEDWKQSEENFATDWNYETSVYVNPNDKSKVYFRWNGHYMLCRREKSIFLK